MTKISFSILIINFVYKYNIVQKYTLAILPSIAAAAIDLATVIHKVWLFLTRRQLAILAVFEFQTKRSAYTQLD